MSVQRESPYKKLDLLLLRKFCSVGLPQSVKRSDTRNRYKATGDFQYCSLLYTYTKISMCDIIWRCMCASGTCMLLGTESAKSH